MRILINRMNENISKLTSKNHSKACAAGDEIITESNRSDKWYGNFNTFALLLDHPNSFVRNHVLHILAANAQWDGQNRVNEVLPKILFHITDEKPVTSRQCIRALEKIG